MLTPHEEELLEAILTGVRREDEPEVAAALAASPALAAELDELRSMQSGLEALGTEAQGAVEAAIRGRADDGAQELVARTIGDLPLPLPEADRSSPARPASAESPGRARGPRPLWVSVALIAAALLLWIGAGLFDRGDGPPQDTLLGEGIAIEVLAPEGSAVGVGGFTWEATAGAAGSYRVAVYPEGEDEVLFEAVLTEPRWILTDDQRAALPASIRIDVRAATVGGGTAPGGWRVVRRGEH